MIRFMQYRLVYLLISLAVIVPGIFALLVWGIRPSIDFTGGTLLELEIGDSYKDRIGMEQLRALAQEETIEINTLSSVEAGVYVLKAKAFDQAKNTSFQEKIASASGVATVSAVLTEKRFETLGPTLGAETLRRAMIAIGVASVGILLFVWRQFKDKKYGITAIIAMFHDTLVVVGIFALLGHFYQVEVDTLFMTAVLTVLSFSVHDTIVVYDRIRESLHKIPGEKYEVIVDKAINETIGRSVNNSMTIIFMLLALYVLGGETIRWFVFALLVGTISGTYSSAFVAAPLLVEWERWFGKKK